MYPFAPFLSCISRQPDALNPAGDQAELIRRLESERIPNGLAFATPAAVVQLDDSLPVTKARRDALAAALDDASPVVHGRNPRLRVVA